MRPSTIQLPLFPQLLGLRAKAGVRRCRRRVASYHQQGIVQTIRARAVHTLGIVELCVLAGVEQNAIAVPDSSVLRDDENQPFVYVATGSNQFGRRPVEIGQSEAGKTQILKGLSPGDRVVGDGSLFLQFANSFQH